MQTLIYNVLHIAHLVETPVPAMCFASLRGRRYPLISVYNYDVHTIGKPGAVYLPENVTFNVMVHPLHVTLGSRSSDCGGSFLIQHCL